MLSTVIKTLTALILGVLCFTFWSCKSQSPNEEKWWLKPQQEWPQILLIHHLEFDGRNTVEGASAFLLIRNRDTVLCTVRHILEKPMGIKPPVPQDSVNVLMKNWTLAPRASTGFDSLRVAQLINSTPSEDDFLLLKLQNRTNKIAALYPASKAVVKDEKVYIIGCERESTDCSQDVWTASVAVSDSEQLIIKPENKFAAAGFSGAPVINKDGKLVGMIYGVYDGEEGFFLYLIPASKLIAPLRQSSPARE